MVYKTNDKLEKSIIKLLEELQQADVNDMNFKEINNQMNEMKNEIINLEIKKTRTI